jgi:hypothetical protein
MQLSDLTWSSTLQQAFCRHSIARTVFMAGDAAHLHSPAGRIKLGIQMPISNVKLALIHHGQGLPGLLDSYRRNGKTAQNHRKVGNATKSSLKPLAQKLRNQLAGIVRDRRDAKSDGTASRCSILNTGIAGCGDLLPKSMVSVS